MPDRHHVASTDEFSADGDRVIVAVEGIEIAVIYHDGEFHGLLHFCPHQSGPLCDGELTGRTGLAEDGFRWTYDTDERYVLCPWHGWKFDITTGVNVDQEAYRVPTFDVEVENGEVYVKR